MGLADLHIHTIYSYDGTASVPVVLKRARRRGDRTRHDRIRWSLSAGSDHCLEEWERTHPPAKGMEPHAHPWKLGCTLYRQ